MNAANRTAAPGSFVELADGMVHYELSGPVEAPTVVLVHGALTPMFIWDPLLPVLHEAGFRVLRYDNFGRGWSDRPRARYDEHLYVRQLRGLLDELHIPRPVHLVGVSQGGAISTVYAAGFPEEVGKLALLAPAGMPRRRSVGERLATLPGFGHLLMQLAGPEIVLLSLKLSVNSRRAAARLRPLVAEQMGFTGFKRSLLAMLREFPIGGLSATYEVVGRQDRDIFLLWGTADQTLPFEQSVTARRLLPQAQFHEIHDGAHIVHWVEPHRVNPLLVSFLRDQRTKADEPQRQGRD